MGGIVLALSGGGAKAAAHVGALRALEEAGLAPERAVGTSMGAVVAAGWAAGLGWAEMLRRVQGLTRRDVALPNRLAVLGGLYLSGLLQDAPLRRTIGALLPATRFAELVRPLTVTAVELETGALALFGAGGDAALAEVPLVDALYASCALPMFYPAAVIGGRRYGDGGLRGVLPLEAVQRVAPDAELVVAVDIGPGFDEEPGEVEGELAADLVRAPAPAPLPAMVRAHNDALGALMAAHGAAQLALWRADPARPPLLYVRPRVERHATFRVDRLAAYAEEGYRATRAVLAAHAARP
ncbi:MAG TPA: patatin-like phospholipase family protein [Gemmatimonadales bacterium]|nr:patatin-like phospholipase family protein [Gemmatimonadales bacterium]